MAMQIAIIHVGARDCKRDCIAASHAEPSSAFHLLLGSFSASKLDKLRWYFLPILDAPTLEIFPLHPSEYAYQVYLTQVHSHIASLIYDLQRFCMKEAFHCIPLHPPDLQSIISSKSSLDPSSPIR